MPDTAPVQAIPVDTDTSGPVTAARTALDDHKKRCPHCHAERTRPGAPLCSRKSELITAWRQALREAAAQTTTTGGAQ